MTLEKTVSELEKKLTDQEKRQDEVLSLSREIIRLCAKAIRHYHTGNPAEAKTVLKNLDGDVKRLSKVSGEDFQHIAQNAYQEYAEIACLSALLEREKLPTPSDLGIDTLSYLAGVADCVGELRRSLQLSLRAGKKEDAEYLFEKMNYIYDNLMVLKFSSSLVGPLKRKQDMVRGQVEQARSEMLR